ncbi:uncharacterized protein LOC115215701 isoform X4 [Octopus vulgaris]|uniref:Uncharacterized protein LOC115215701 isoform X4 n=1 Tax=Octopus vulgaris TaxID=6645 RepID=A0AA36B6C9_OCTVU|nr:uncharacterized protein LOC115215701 isoform X4 [Octopus vulgaris]
MFCVIQAQLKFLLISVCILLVYANQTDVCEAICKCLKHSTIDCTNRNLTSIPQAIPADVVTLRLEGNKIANIENGSLEGLDTLKTLFLGNNMITNIEDGSWKGLSKLQNLYLEDNKIDNIDGAFKGLDNLHILELRNNTITTIDERSFQFLHNLKEIYLDSNNITYIEKETFKGLYNLKELRLPSNHIVTIDESWFQDLTNLTSLHLAYNEIRNIENGSFKNLDQLEELGLDGNGITNIGNGFWQHLQNLKRLNLAYNEISNIEEGKFENLDSLKKLDLTDNRITKIEDGSWQHLEKLKELDLSKNRITKIGDDSWQHLQNLKKLTLSMNQISNIGESSFKNLVNLEELNLKNNEIKEYQDGAFSFLSSIIKIDLSGNKDMVCGCHLPKLIERISETDNRSVTVLGDCIGAGTNPIKFTHTEKPSHCITQTINYESIQCHVCSKINCTNPINCQGSKAACMTTITKHDEPMVEKKCSTQEKCVEAERGNVSNCNNWTSGNSCVTCCHTDLCNQKVFRAQTINFESIQCHVCSKINCTNPINCQGSKPACMTTITKHDEPMVEKKCSTQEKCVEAERGNVSNCNNWTSGNSCVTCCHTDLCNQKVFRDWTSFQLYLLYKRQGNKNENLETISKELEKNFSNMPGIYTVKNCGAQSKTEVFIIHCHVPKNITKEQVKEKARVILRSKALRSLGFGPDSELSDKKFCDEDITKHNGTFQWPVTKIGDTVSISCLAHIATRSCVQGNAATTCPKLPKQSPFTGVWKEADMSQCNNTKWINPELKKMKDRRIKNCHIEYLSKKLLNISQKSVYFKKIDVVLAVAIYEKIMLCIPNATKEDLLRTINNIINTPEKILIEAEKSNRSVSRILDIMGNVSEKLQVEEKQFKALYSKLGIGITKVNKNNFQGLFYGILPATSKTKAKNVIYQFSYPNDAESIKMMDYISIPKTLSKHLKNSNRISFYSMNNDKLYRVIQRSGDGKDSKPESFINSRIIAANIPKQRISNLENPINISFNLLYKNGSNSRCVFWDDTSGHDPHWSTSGCKTERKEKVYCSCNHLTSFAILTDVDQNAKLYIICYIGCGISLVFLILTIIVHAGFKNLWKIIPSKILVNLCGSLAITHLIVLVGMRPGKSNVICKAMAILLHYFLIASAMWITVEALHICQALITTFSACQRSFVMKSSISAWGVPGIIVMLTLIIKKTNNYIRITAICWLSEIPFSVAFLIPMGLILLISLILFLLIIGRLFSMKKEKQCERKTRKFRLFGIVNVFFLFGASWALAYYIFFGGAATVFIYICAISHAFQGLFIFIYYCVCDKNARSVICSNSCNKKKYVLNKNSQNNSGENPDNETEGVKYSNSEDKTAEVKL